MTGEEFCQMALGFPESCQGGHFDVTDFRVGKTIFCTFRPTDGRAVLRLAPDAQAMLCAGAAETFSPLPGSWGLKGWTVVHLATADPDAVRHGMHLAWRGVAPRRLAAGKQGA